MATDVERLVVSLEASITKYERTMQRALGVTNNTMQRIERRHETMTQRLEKGAAGMQRGLATAFAGAATLRGAQQLIDASIGVTNSLKISGLAGEELTKVYDTLFASAQRNAAPIESLATLYGRAASVQKELGASSQDLLKFTDNISVALRVNGRSSEESAGALLQLGQALGSARVMAEEFNSINEGARPILQAAAAGIDEAGGSVARLKQLVIEGKISNQAFFQGIQAGSVILQDKLVGAEASISQSFIRLRNVLIDVAGDFNTGTGASASFAASLDQLGVSIQNLNNNDGFLKFLEDWNNLGNQMYADTAREFKQISDAVDSVKSALTNMNAEVDRTQAAASEAQTALEGFAAANTFTGEVEAAFEDLVNQLINGRGDIDSTRAAIMAMGTADPSFDKVIGKVDILTTTFIRLREAAYSALRAATQTPVPTHGGFAGQESDSSTRTAGTAVKPISAADYPVIGSGGGGGSGGGKSKVDTYNQAVANQEKETLALQRKTSLLAQLNPLVNDYGFAVEKLNAQIELENAATQAGLALTPERQAQIAMLSQGFAQATSEAARLAEAQDKVKESADALASAGREALDSIIDGFLEGKDAGELFGSVLADLGKSLLKLGLNSLLDGIGGGGGLLSGLFGGKGFATGTANTGGARGEPRGVVHGQEAVIPLPNGGRVPVDIRLPSMPRPQAGSSGGGQVEVGISVGVDESGNLLPIVTRVAGQVSGQAIKANNKQLPGIMRNYNQRQG